MSSHVESEQARINEERDLHEIFKIWEQRYSTSSYDPEPIVRRQFHNFRQFSICFDFFFRIIFQII